MKRKYFGTNGIRGEFGKLINPKFLSRMSLAIASSLNNKGTIVLGSDSRLSSPFIKHIITANLIASGIEIIDLGIVPTPLVQFAVTHLKAHLGTVITASHNPPEFNGIKVIDSDGIEISIKKQLKLEENFEKNISNFTKWDKVADVSTMNLIPDYVEQIVSVVDEEKIRKRKLTAVVDGGNSVGGLVTPLVLKRLGIKVISINCQLDGRFPGRGVEPSPEELGKMSNVASYSKADFAIAHDGDADRAIFGDEKGSVFYGDRSIAIFEKWVFGNIQNKKFVTPVSSSNVVIDIAEELGVEIIWTPVGCIYVSRTMIESKSMLGGEENGGLFYAPHQCVRDGAMAAALMANIIAETNRTLSELEKELPKYHQKKEKIKCSDFLKEKVMSYIENNVPKEVEVNTIDGLKLIYPAGWILIRPSGTEPIFRIFVESNTEKDTNEKMKKGITLVNNAVEKYS